MNNSQGKKKSTFIASETILAAAYFDFWAGGVNYRISKDNFFAALAGSTQVMSQKTGIVANPGGGQAGATILNKQYNRIDVVASWYDSVRLESATPGTLRIVVNETSNGVNLYPSSGEYIYDTSATDAPALLLQNETVVLYCFETGIWDVLDRYQRGTDYIGYAVSAGGLASALLLRTEHSAIHSAAADHNSVKLRDAYPGTRQAIWNNTAYIIDVYPNNASDSIGGLGSGAPFELGPGKSLVVYCYSEVNWMIESTNA